MRKSLFSERHERLRRLLIEARKVAGLTWEDLGEKLAAHQQFVSRHATGERRLDVIEFLDVAAAIGVDTLELLKRIDEAGR